ncbi:MAG: nucleotidyltransferase domain-containing protein [Deltaproteobacteria bacterium]|nr:nucleotidyltransferase domain-containing protein [Deltaproteobacteria bacterium]
MAEVDRLIMDKVRAFLTRLEARGIRVERAYVFGSYARGSAGEWSGIDVAVVSRDVGYDRFEELARLMSIASTIDTRIEPVPFRPDTFVDEDPLAWEIKRNGVELS